MGIRLYAYKWSSKEEFSFERLKEIYHSDKENDFLESVDTWEKLGGELSDYKSLLSFVSAHQTFSDRTNCSFFGCEIIDEEAERKYWKEIYAFHLNEDNSVVNMEVLLRYIEASESLRKTESNDLLIKLVKHAIENKLIVIQG